MRTHEEDKKLQNSSFKASLSLSLSLSRSLSPATTPRRRRRRRRRMKRRHGWQLPLHPLQIVGMGVFTFLVVSFYVLLGPFLGNKVIRNTILTLYSFAASSAAVLFIRCTAIDPSDRTGLKMNKRKRNKLKRLPKLNYKSVIYQVIIRFFWRIENKILKSCIRRRYLDPRYPGIQMEPLLPFPLILVDDAVSPNHKDDDINFCALCDFEVKKHSKHCRSCDRCVDGFDHHCRWLNNCIGRKNYTTFILLMVFVLLMLTIQGGSAVAIFVRCFAAREAIEIELQRWMHLKFPRGVLAATSVLLALLAAYSSAALGQLFFFHVVLIRKGMRTYDYILAMREENEYDPFDDLDISSDESDLDSPEKPSLLSKILCRRDKVDQDNQRLSIRIDKESSQTTSDKKTEFRIDPWKLITMSKEKAMVAADRAREKIMKQRLSLTTGSPQLKPLQSESKRGPSESLEKKSVAPGNITPVVTKSWFSRSPRERFSSPRRRFSGSPSPKPQTLYRNNFDLKLTEVSRELDTYISRQVLTSVLKKEGDEASPI